ncbi:MAG: hypothetical protein HC927_10005 [Deltaproteobacteria bacterium]|nr:hypothetical protein [Deltaproteobacteria bacterium]
MYRATLDLPPLQRWVDAEVCSNGEAESDAMTGTPHGPSGSAGSLPRTSAPAGRARRTRCSTGASS